jgi:hypothetical protein
MIVEPDRLRTFLVPFDGDEPDMLFPPSLLEDVGAPAHLVVHGSVTLTQHSQGFSGTLTGAFEAVSIRSPWDYQVTGQCISNGHQFMLRR